MQRILVILRAILEALASPGSSSSRTGSRAPRSSGKRSSDASGRRGSSADRSRGPAGVSQRRESSAGIGAAVSPGQAGEQATVEADPRSLGTVAIGYRPQRDGAPDPGEVVWTWVPFEERDGRGKDRPVLVVAELSGDRSVAISLTSHERGGPDYVPVGVGDWDSQGRPSWAVLDRVFVVRDGGVRREAAAMKSEVFAVVAQRLASRYGWTSAV
ncbi:MAG: type II toxin-antitoxin system PemK/MazF family toxin [Mycetocola sp.]